MRLLWFSPLPPAATEIARYSAGVLPAIARRVEVVAMVEGDTVVDAAVSDVVPVVRYRWDGIATAVDAWRHVDERTMCVFHIGNNPDFHTRIWRVSQQVPGIVVVHDARLQHLFFDLHQAVHSLARYERAMHTFYGRAGREAAQRRRADQATSEEVGQQFPLTPWATTGAAGILVHTRYAFDECRWTSPAPIVEVPLPYAGRAAPPPRNTRSSPPYRVVVFGHLNRSRRVAELVEALDDDRLRPMFHLDVYGTLPDDSLAALVDEREMGATVTIHGFVSDAALTAALDEADLAVNLRNPDMGEASASQLRIWDHALPSIVSRTGWYATIPEEAATFVDQVNERDGLRSHLLAFAADPAGWQAQGRQGYDLLLRRHRPDRYADALVALALGARDHARNRAAATFKRRVAGLDVPGGDASAAAEALVPTLPSAQWSAAAATRSRRSLS